MALPPLHKIVRFLTEPDFRRRAILRRRGKGLISERLKYEALRRNDYAYGMYHGALQARSLGIKRVSALEFGVFKGEGLQSMERIAFGIGRELGVRYEIYGFDTGAGMPPPSDARDMGFIWEQGLFAPEKGDVLDGLKRAKMILGDIAQTGPRFCADHSPPPIAFVSVDVDYYTSSVAALSVFDEDARFLLPRVFVYLDDIIGDDHELHSIYTGELAAVEKFNREHDNRKIAQINGLRWKRLFPAAWNDQMFVAHLFDHPRYGEFTNTSTLWERPAKPAPPAVTVLAGANGNVTAPRG